MSVLIAGVEHGLGDEHCAGGRCHGGMLMPIQDPETVLPRPHGCTTSGCLLHATEDIELGDLCGKP